MFNKIWQLSYLDRIKLIMLSMMSAGHLAWAFVVTDSLLGQLLHFYARSTIVLACFLVVQGFLLSGDLIAYAKRLFGFGLLAQIPFVMMMTGVWQLVYYPLGIFMAGNVLFTLGFCLLSLMLWRQALINKTWDKKIPFFILIIGLCYLAEVLSLDWGFAPIIWTIALYQKKVWGLLGSFAILIMGAILFDNELLDSIFGGRLMDYGFILAIPIILWYEKNKQNSPKKYRLPRTFFYWYYVIHALIIGLLVQFTPYATNEYGIIMESNGEYRSDMTNNH